MFLQTGVIRLALLNTDGTKAKTLLLPPPTPGGVDLEWARKATTKELLDGSERTRLRGYLPVLTCKWPAYDDRTGQGVVIGTADGQRPALEDLLWFLSQPTGKIRVSPGTAAGGFTVDSIQVQPLGKKGPFYTGLQVVFRGRDALPTMTLGVF
jgi:hypothetical protein